MLAAPDQTVFYVEDDEPLRLATVQALELAGLRVRAFAAAAPALAALDAQFTGVIVSDIRMARMDGLQLLAQVRALDPDIPVILVTGHGDVPMAVSALHDGAFDFLTKPFAGDQLIAAIRRGLDRRGLVIENRKLREAAAAAEREPSPLIGESAVMDRLRALIGQLADTSIDILIQGETGTGKELVALMLHRQGARRGKPLVAVNCGALTEGSAELDLFGHAADSVAATRLSRAGRIAQSDGGILLLDEIDSTPLAVQAKLLRVLEEREVQPIGADRPQPVNLRVIATAKQDMQQAVADGAFRADLYYRLSAMRLQVPPLRERGADVFLLFAAFIEEARRQLGLAEVALDATTRAYLQTHRWPGNVRELRNFAFEVAAGEPVAGMAGERWKPLPARLAEFEAAMIREALARHHGRIAPVIAELGIPRKTFYDKVARLGIDPGAHRDRGASS